MQNKQLLSEQLSNLLNRMSTMKVDSLGYIMYRKQYEAYLEGIDDVLETLELFKDFNSYFEDFILPYPIITLGDLSTQELISTATINRNLIHINIDINFMMLYNNTNKLPTTLYYENAFNSYSFIKKVSVIIDMFTMIKLTIEDIINLYSDTDDE